MRFGLLLYGSLDTVSGGYLYDRMLVRRLRERGDTVDIISIPWRNYAAHLADNFSPLLLRRLREGRYDALLQDELNHPSLFLANRIASARRIAIVHHLRASEHRPAWQNILYRFVERRYLDGVDGFIFNSRTTLAAVDRLSPLGQRPRVVALPAGNRFGPPLDPDRIRDRAARPGPIKLLFVGNLIPRKGLHTLLDALARIPNGWELSVAGSLQTGARYAESIRRSIGTKRLAAVTLLGSLDESQLGARFSQSDALIVPSSYEGYGIVYLEGMGFGLPAIATTAGAAREIITHGRDGFLIAPNDSAALADHIRALIADRSLLAQMSLAARERFLRHPTWEQSMGTARDFLQKIVSH